MNILLFGCGGNIKKAINFLSVKNKILGLIDSNIKIHNTSINGYTVFPPSDILKFEFDYIYITSMYRTEIYSSLIGLGIEPEKIKVFRPQNKFTYFIYYLYPLYGILPNIQRLFLTLWNCRVFIKDKASEFSSFTARNGITFLFYWTQYLNLHRFGFSGKSNYIGTGSYEMGRFWHLTYIAHFLFRRFGTLSTVIGSFVWLISHFIWIINYDVDLTWLIFILIILLFSSYFYGLCFVTQNYNIFGWSFLPLGLYFALNGSYWVASIIWIFASFGSLTVVSIVFFVCIFISVKMSSWLPLLTVLPATFRFCFKFLNTSNPKTFMFDLIKILGFTNFINKDTKYRYEISKSIFHTNRIIFLFSWTVFCLILFFLDNEILLTMCCSILALAILNFSFVRFADDQSIHFAMLSVASISTILTHDLILLISFYLSIYVSPHFISSSSNKKSNLWPCPLKPFKITNICKCACNFFSKIPIDSRILIICKDPCGKYNNLFDGYRNIYELAYYVANLQKILVFPDWYAIGANNNNNSNSFWGTSIDAVNKNIRTWNADYILIYQPSKSDLDTKWKNDGFSKISTLDWGDLLNEDLDGEICWDSLNFTPKWFLLRKS